MEKIGTLAERLESTSKLLSELAAEVREKGSDFHSDCLNRAAQDCMSAARARNIH